jgi:hypothetical protein
VERRAGPLQSDYASRIVVVWGETPSTSRGSSRRACDFHAAWTAHYRAVSPAFRRETRQSQGEFRELHKAFAPGTPTDRLRRQFSQAARTATFREPRSSIFVIRRLDLEQTPTKIIHTAAWKKADGPDHENIPTCA